MLASTQWLRSSVSSRRRAEIGGATTPAAAAPASRSRRTADTRSGVARPGVGYAESTSIALERRLPDIAVADDGMACTAAR